MTFEITIPVLNEEKTLQQNVQTLEAFLLDQLANSISWKIVIADNGSTDSTKSIAQNLASVNKGIHFVSVSEKGVGAALQASWLNSKADFIGYMDLDLATDLRHLHEVIDALVKEEYDLVYGTRLHKNSKVIGRSFKRTLSSNAFNAILKYYLNINFSDGMCGFKFLKRKTLEPLLKNGAQSKGWFFSTELLAVGEHLNLKIKELPVIWTDDTSSSHVKILPLAKKYLKEMRTLKRRLKK